MNESEVLLSELRRFLFGEQDAEQNQQLEQRDHRHDVDDVGGGSGGRHHRRRGTRQLENEIDLIQ